MAAPIQAPGFSDPGEEFLATGMASLQDPGQEFLGGGPAFPAVEEHHHRLLVELGVALGAAFLVMRHQMAKQLAQADNPRPDQSADLAHQTWQDHLPLWIKLSVPVIRDAMARYAGGAEAEELAQDYCTGLGDYLDQTSAEGLALGFTRQLEDRQNEKLAWQRATNAYGLGPREMFSYISGVMRNPHTSDGGNPNQAALDKLLLRRADLIGSNEVWRARQSTRALVWGLRFRAGRYPPGTKIEWDTREDELTCVQCGPMDHQRVDPGSPFIRPGGITVFSSPLHPGCRCEMALISPVEIVKSIEEEPRDSYGRWTAQAARNLDEPDPDAAAGAFARPGAFTRPGGRLVRSAPFERPAAKVEAPPSPSPPTRDEFRRPEGSTGPTREPYTRPAAAAPAPRPTKAKKSKKHKKAKQRPAGKLIPFVAPAPPAPKPKPPVPSTAAPAPSRADARAASVITAPPVAMNFWRDNVELLEEVRDDARTDARTIATRKLATADVDAIYALAELTPPSAYRERREQIARAIEHGGGSNLSEAYLDYVVYAKPQAAGGAGLALAEEADAHGVDTSRVRPMQEISYESYAHGDSRGNITGQYEIAAASYESSEGVTPGIPGRRRVVLRPAPISKSMSGFGIAHASVTG